MTETPRERWEGMGAEEVAREAGLPAAHLFESVGSTNDVARRLAASGAPAGSLVLAERQLAGRGRAGRAWDSPAGLGLWMSIVLRPGSLPDPGAAPLLVGLRAAQALEPFVRPGALGVKWPNDLLAGGRKLGGILCEAVWEGERPAFLVAGVGLNVLHAPDDFPEEIRAGATSVAAASGRAPERREIALAVSRALGELSRGPLELTPEHLSALERLDVLRGREVVVSEPATGALAASGTAIGISPRGALLLRSLGGAIRTVHSGTVRPAAPAAPTPRSE